MQIPSEYPLLRQADGEASVGRINLALPPLGSKMKPDSAATYERARRLANQALWTVDLQHRRLNSVEPGDDKFIFRKWSDFHFLIVALTRLRRAAELAAKVPAIREQVHGALQIFDAALPHLKKMRDVAEHIDDYAVDTGKDSEISRRSLEHGHSDGETWQWLGFELDVSEALSASISLFDVLKDSGSLLEKGSSNQCNGHE